MTDFSHSHFSKSHVATGFGRIVTSVNLLTLIGFLLVILLSLTAIFYGAWLNERGEAQITKRMESRELILSGAKAEMRTIHQQIKINTINLYTDVKADAVALSNGKITECYAQKGVFVRQGEVLFNVIDEDLPLSIQDADAAILEAESEVKHTGKTFKRYKELRAVDAVSAEDYDSAEAAYTAAIAKRDSAVAKRRQLDVTLSRQHVVAPMEGKVLVLYKHPGEYVSTGTPLALIGDFQTLSFTLPVEDKNTRYLSQGEQVELTFSNDAFVKKVYGTEYGAGNMGSKQKFLANIMEITPPLSEPAAMRTIMCQVDNSIGLLEPQTYGFATLRAVSSDQLLTVPLTAMMDSDNSVVFVAQDDGRIERRKVKTGVSDDAYIEIISGLKAGETVVIEDDVGLKDGMKAKVIVKESEQGEAEAP